MAEYARNRRVHDERRNLIVMRKAIDDRLTEIGKKGKS